MASGIKVVMNIPGCRAVRTSGGVRADIMARAKRIAARANGMVSDDEMRNDAFMVSDASGQSRARAHVFAASPHGIYSQNKHGTLLNALDAGR